MLKITLHDEPLLRWFMFKPFLWRFVRADLTRLDQYQDQALLDAIYTHIKMANRVAKTTCPGRFNDLDAITVQMLERRKAPVRLHDVAVSSGITALELYQRLRAANIAPDYHISDKYARLQFVQNGALTRIYDADRQLIQVYCAGLFADHQTRWFFPLSKLLFLQARRWPLPETFSGDLLLYDRKVIAALESGILQHQDYDVFTTPMSGRYDYVRCMNLLNSAYFSEPRLQKAVLNLSRSLKPGGILQIGRSLFPNGENRVSFYRRDGGRLRLIHHHQGGSEIHDLIKRVA